jgi:N-acetylglucosaminyl-diphospho-decaprenol L-rhamnosyltransferase
VQTVVVVSVIEKTSENFGSVASPDITVVVVNYNTGYLLDRLFSNLGAARGSLNVQVIVIDNVSHDNSVEILREKYPDVTLIQNSTNVGFGRANNQSLPLILSRYVLLLNTDAFVSADTLAKTVSFMEANPKCGILGVKLVGETGELQPSCRYFPTPWNVFLTKTGLNRFVRGTRLVDDMAWDHASIRECDWVPGCYYLVRRKLIEQIGLFDPRFFLYYEEVDHCRAARNGGWTVTFYPFTTVVHIGGESAKSHGPLTGAGQQFSALQVESELLYFRKHHGRSGLLAHILLTICSDTYLAIKGVLRLPDTRETFGALKHLKIALKALTDTKLGSQATR